MPLFLEPFTRFVTRCALFLISSIFLVSITLLVTVLFVRHPNECLRNPIKGLDADNSDLGSKLRHYRKFIETTTWQPKFSKVTTTYSANSHHAPVAEAIHFTPFEHTLARTMGSAVQPSSEWPISNAGTTATPSRQQRRLLDVAACSGWSDKLIARNSLPLPYRSIEHDDLLSPQSVWALCMLADTIEHSKTYSDICRRLPLPAEDMVEEVTKNSEIKSYEDTHNVDMTDCCPVIGIHTFIQMVFPHKDPCHYSSKMALHQAETLRQDLFFCQRSANDPRFANESYPFCNDFRDEIKSFLTFLADKDFLKETQSLSYSNIWLPLKDEAESHDRDTNEHDLEIAERLVRKLEEHTKNESMKIQLLFSLPKSPNVVKMHQRRRMLQFQHELPKSSKTIAVIITAAIVSFVMLVLISNCSILRIIGMLFAFFCIFSIGYFFMVVVNDYEPPFIGLVLSTVFAFILFVDAFFIFNESMARAISSARKDTRSFQLTVQDAISNSIPSFACLTLVQSSLMFFVLGFLVDSISVMRFLCHFTAILTALTFLIMIVWLPGMATLSFRNKQTLTIQLSESIDNGTKACCVSCENRCRGAVKQIAFAMEPLYNIVVEAFTSVVVRFNIVFCIIPIVIVAAALAVILYFGFIIDLNTESTLTDLFTIPVQSNTDTMHSISSTSETPKFPYQDQLNKYSHLLKETNHSKADPFFDCSNKFQRFSFVFHIDNHNSGRDILFTEETQVWFRRFCNESLAFLQAGGTLNGADAGASHFVVHSLRECALDKLLPYFEQRSCSVLRNPDDSRILHDPSPCCANFKFPWKPAVYKQCLRQYVIDQIFKGGREPNIDIRFSKNGSTEVGFIVEYDVTYLEAVSNGSLSEPGSCTLMLDLYQKTVIWFDSLLMSAPFQLRNSPGVFVVSPQLTGQNIRITVAKSLLFGLVGCLFFVSLTALIGTLNIIHTTFVFMSALCGSMMASAIILSLRWTIGLYEVVLSFLLLLPMIGKSCNFVAIVFRRCFYVIAGQTNDVSRINVESITRLTLQHSLSVLLQSFIFTTTLSVPMIFSEFLFAKRLAQFLTVISGVSIFVALFCLLPFLSRFAIFARKYGVPASFNTSSTQSRKARHVNIRATPSSSISPKSSSITSGGPASHSSATDDEPIPLRKPAPALISSDAKIVASVLVSSQRSIRRSRNDAKKINVRSDFGNAFTSKSNGHLPVGNAFSSKSNGHLPDAFETLNSSELIWVPRFPAAGVPLEDFAITPPSPNDLSPPFRSHFRSCTNKQPHSTSMSTSWSATSSSFGVVAQPRNAQPPVPSLAPMAISVANGHATVGRSRTPGQSRSFHGTNTADSFTLLANNDTSNDTLQYSPFYHAVMDSNKEKHCH